MNISYTYTQLLDSKKNVPDIHTCWSGRLQLLNLRFSEHVFGIRLVDRSWDSRVLNFGGKTNETT